jgi:uncharacterized membrane protein
VNGAVSKFWGISIFPLIMLLFVGIWALLPHIDPIAPGFKGFRRVYDFFMMLVIALLAYSYALTLGINLGLQLNVLPMILPALAVLVCVLGALLPYVKRNWFFGIRTPWSLSSDIVWNKTHKLGSLLLELAAFFILLAAFLPKAVAPWLVAIPLIAAALISIVYSYVVFRAQRT